MWISFFKTKKGPLCSLRSTFQRIILHSALRICLNLYNGLNQRKQEVSIPSHKKILHLGKPSSSNLPYDWITSETMCNRDVNCIYREWPWAEIKWLHPYPCNSLVFHYWKDAKIKKNKLQKENKCICQHPNENILQS